jgi:hypothetical protein
LDESILPGFHACFENCLEEIHELSLSFSLLLAEALGLPANVLDKFYKKSLNIHANVCCYLPITENKDNQGIGAHYNAEFLTFICPTLFVLKCCFDHLTPPGTGSYKFLNTKGPKYRTSLAPGSTQAQFREP